MGKKKVTVKKGNAKTGMVTEFMTFPVFGRHGCGARGVDGKVVWRSDKTYLSVAEARDAYRQWEKSNG